ncbi:hypothetical protein JCM11491_005630 [Sporobolomyces phaffii]
MTTFFDQLAQLATGVLLGLFPPATLANGGKVPTPAGTPSRAAIGTSSPRGTRQARVGFFDPMPIRPTSSPRRKQLSFSGSEASSTSSAPLSPPRSRASSIRALQAERNAAGLSLERPLKSCFRKCRANETFGLPSTRPGRRSSLSLDRRVVFANPIDDGGNSPRHPSIAVPDAEPEQREAEVFVVALALPRTVRPRLAHPYRAGPPRKVASLSVEARSPQVASRLRTPPMAGARRRTVAYSF